MRYFLHWFLLGAACTAAFLGVVSLATRGFVLVTGLWSVSFIVLLFLASVSQPRSDVL